jgi:hypothetical protein
MRKDSLLQGYYYNKLPKAKVGMQTGDPNQPYHPITNPEGYKSDVSTLLTNLSTNAPTSAQNGNWLNKLIVENVYPYGGFGHSESEYKIDNSIQKELSQQLKDGKLTLKEYKEKIAQNSYNKKGKKLSETWNRKMSMPTVDPSNLNASYDALYIHQGFPQKYNSFVKSQYKPTDSKNPNATYYSLSPSLEKEILEDLTNYKNKDFINSNEQKRQVKGSLVAQGALKDFQYSKGKDEKGDYISYYDINDYDNPLDWIGNPFEIYGRIYLDPKTGKPKFGPGGQTTDGCPAGYYKHSLLGCVPIPGFQPVQKEQAQLKKSTPIVKGPGYGQKVDPYERIIEKETAQKQSERNKDLAKRAGISAALAAGIVTGGAALPYIAPALEAPLLGTLGAEYGAGALTTGNLLNAGFAYEGAKNLPNVTAAWKNVGDKPTWSGVGNALGQTALTGLNILPFASAASKGIPSAIQDLGLNKVKPWLANKTNASAIKLHNTVASKLPPGPLRDHLQGIAHGVADITNPFIKRPFFETFPITKAQKLKVAAMQDKEALDAQNFAKDWLYGTNTQLRPEVEKRLLNLYPELRSWHPKNMELTDFDNPISTLKNLSVSTRRNDLLSNQNISDAAKASIYQSRGAQGGVNIKNSNEAITLRNKGLYYYRPKTFGETAGHEITHSWQNLGYSKPSNPIAGKNYSWIENIESPTPDNLYYEGNPKTKIGKRFNNAMVEAPSGKYTWEAAPSELHADLMPARKEIYDFLIKEAGHTPEQAMKRLQNLNNQDAEYLINFGNLDKFFKPETPLKEQINLIKMLPSVTPYVAGAGLLSAAGKNWLKEPKKEYGGPLVEFYKGKMTGPNIFANGGPGPGDGKTLPPIYTNDPRKVRAYNDSLVLSNFSKLQHQLEPTVTNWMNPFASNKTQRNQGQFILEKVAQDLVNNNSNIDWELGRYSGTGAKFIKNSSKNPNIKKGYIMEQYYPEIWKDEIVPEYIENQSPDIIHKTIKPVGHWWGRGQNNEYISPVQPYILQQQSKPKQNYWTEKDIPTDAWKTFIKKYPGAIGMDPNHVDKNNQHVPIYPSKPEEPTLKRKVSKMEPIRSSYTPSLSLRTIQTPNIQLPNIPMGKYRTSYWDPEMKDWNERSFMSQQESDQFANEMSQRGYAGPYGNVTQRIQYANGGAVNLNSIIKQNREDRDNNYYSGGISKYEQGGQANRFFYNKGYGVPRFDEGGQGPCPAGMYWDTVLKKCVTRPAPFVTSDIDEYNRRTQLATDSTNAANSSAARIVENNANSAAGNTVTETNASPSLHTSDKSWKDKKQVAKKVTKFKKNPPARYTTEEYRKKLVEEGNVPKAANEFIDNSASVISGNQVINPVAITDYPVDSKHYDEKGNLIDTASTQYTPEFQEAKQEVKYNPTFSVTYLDKQGKQQTVYVKDYNTWKKLHDRFAGSRAYQSASESGDKSRGSLLLGQIGDPPSEFITQEPMEYPYSVELIYDNSDPVNRKFKTQEEMNKFITNEYKHNPHYLGNNNVNSTIFPADNLFDSKPTDRIQEVIQPSDWVNPPKKWGGPTRMNQFGYLVDRKANGGSPYPINLNLPKYEQPKGFFTGYGYGFSPQPNLNIYGVGAYGEKRVSPRLTLSGDINSQSVIYPGGKQMFNKPMYGVGMKYRFDIGGVTDDGKCYDEKGNVIPCEQKRLQELGSDAYTAMQPFYDTVFDAANKYTNEKTGLVSPFNSARAALKGIIKHPEVLFMKRYNLPNQEADPYHKGKYTVDQPGINTRDWWPSQWAEPRKEHDGFSDWWNRMKTQRENKKMIRKGKRDANKTGCWGANCYDAEAQDQVAYGGDISIPKLPNTKGPLLQFYYAKTGGELVGRSRKKA